MRERLARFFYGRNGYDQMAKFCLWFSLILIIVSIVFTQFISPVVGNIIWYVGFICLIYCYFRALSKNIYKRQRENQWFLNKTSRIRAYFKLQKDRIKFGKNYSFFKCPSCKCVLRVPKGKGKIKIKCHKCGEIFIKKT